MRSRKDSTQFAAWSSEFKQARSLVGDLDAVRQVWKKPIPDQWIRENKWKREPGFVPAKKRDCRPGEGIVEEQLFNARLLSISHGRGASKRIYPFVPIYHQMAMTCHSSGQVITDLVGTAVIGAKLKTLMVEVKVDKSAGDAWYAIVENLQQIKLGRGCDGVISGFFSDWKLPAGDAAWGLVLAPAEYWARQTKSCLGECRRLLKMLKTEMHARIACASVGKHHLIRIKKDLSNWA